MPDERSKVLLDLLGEELRAIDARRAADRDRVTRLFAFLGVLAAIAIGARREVPSGDGLLPFCIAIACAVTVLGFIAAAGRRLPSVDLPAITETTSGEEDLRRGVIDARLARITKWKGLRDHRRGTLLAAEFTTALAALLLLWAFAVSDNPSPSRTEIVPQPVLVRTVP